jgi:hypothetical protein
MILAMLCILLSLNVIAATPQFFGPRLTVILGIFVTTAFIIISVISIKNQLGIGPWVFISIGVLFLTLDEFLTIFGNNTAFHPFFITATMVMFSFAALFKYWNIIRSVQGE